MDLTKSYDEDTLCQSGFELKGKLRDGSKVYSKESKAHTDKIFVISVTLEGIVSDEGYYDKFILEVLTNTDIS